MITLTFAHCHVDIFNDVPCLRTVFEDGLVLPAAPNDDLETIDKALRMGYDSTWAMTLDHEILHTLLGLSLGYNWSRVLHHAAHLQTYHEREITHEESAGEEQIVLAIAAHANDVALTEHQKHLLENVNVTGIIQKLMDFRKRIDGV